VNAKVHSGGYRKRRKKNYFSWLLRQTIRKTKFENRKIKLTILAKGGAPSGHNCPVNTITFKIMSRITHAFSVFLFFSISFLKE
jgi:acid phosphatase family membrane protein YuiD